MDLQQQNFDTSNDRFTYREQHAHKHDVLQRIVEAAGSILVSLLALRFVFALLAANPDNGFAAFVYNFTEPFVSPFYSLFSYAHPTVGVSSFEGYTLISMAAYTIGCSALVRLISITRY
jgi:YggT family protein